MTLYRDVRLSLREALETAQREYPTDLVARCGFLRDCADRSSTMSEQALWLSALEITRNGKTRRKSL